MSNQGTPVRTMREWHFTTSHRYAEPFTDVTVRATFTAPSGIGHVIEGFHAGEQAWKVRFNPGEAGTWHWRVESTPPNPDLAQQGSFDLQPGEQRGFITSTPGRSWGFTFENGDPVMIFGDTTYHLFGMAHVGESHAETVRRFMARRAEQGFNLLRIRVPVSEFHQVDGYSDWQTAPLWPWRGSPQNPRFDQFNLPYFDTVDMVMAEAERLEIGIEMIVEGWGDEFPFNSRHIFVPEWEELWFRYLIARYDAFASLWFWQLHNEYEYYPNGDWNYARNGVADRWAMRMAHLVRRLAPHGHVIAIHNGPVLPSFGKRFASDPTVIDTVMYQTWGTTSERDAWLAAGIEDRIHQSLDDWPGTAVLSEWGYEFNPDLPPMMLGHEFLDAEHTRRGAWRGVMCGIGIIHGFENSWGPFMELEQDQPGVADLMHLHRFFHEIAPFHLLSPVAAPGTGSDDRFGGSPLALATESNAMVVVYLPTGGTFAPDDLTQWTTATWFNPRTGELHEAEAISDNQLAAPEPPSGDHPADWVLILRA